MHTLGKVLAFLVVIAAVFASIFTAKLVQVRNSWTAKTVIAKKKFVETEPKILDLERQIEAVKNEIFRSRELWGSFWPAVQTEVKSPDGTLAVNIGAQNGVRDKLLMHAFELQQDGSSIYRGSFLPAEIANDSASLKPNFRVSPDDVRQWAPGTWRWRNQLPPGFSENFDKQLTLILKLEETMADRLRTLEGQKTRLTQASEALKLREAELVGGDVLPKGAVGNIEIREGYVSAVSKEEESRNHTLRKIDELRRAVRAVQSDIERLQEENLELTKKLPQPGPRDQLTQKK